MPGKAYYNENDPKTVLWLRELIREGLIADGEVDDRSITEVQPADLAGFVQHHFFAGIGGWSYALRLAGWLDARPIWTGSCPCQPYSAAGKQAGTSDPRDLWPKWFDLLKVCRPPVVVGEQVEAAIRHGWLDRLQADLEAEGYAVGAVVLGAHSVGGFHRRQRLWFVAESERAERGTGRTGRPGASGGRAYGEPAGPSRDGGLADAQHPERGPIRLPRGDGRDGPDLGREEAYGESGTCGEVRGLADALRDRAEWAGTGELLPDAGRPADLLADPQGHRRRQGDPLLGGSGASRLVADARSGRRQQDPGGASRDEGPDGRRAEGDHLAPSDGENFWVDPVWLPCRDGKSRPTQSGLQFMVDGLPESLGPVRPEGIAALEEAINGATSEANRREAMFNVWLSLAEETLRYQAGGLRSVQEAPVLLAFLCQLADQGWKVSEGVPQSRKETAWSLLRMLRNDDAPSRSPHRRGLDEQRTGEPADLVRVLSSILAFHAQANWGEAFRANACALFPLASGVKNRVVLLRGAGNAVVPQVGAEVIRAYLEVCAERDLQPLTLVEEIA